jgi:hypothetical protein
LQPQDDFLKAFWCFGRLSHDRPLEMQPFHRQDASKGQCGARLCRDLRVQVSAALASLT